MKNVETPIANSDSGPEGEPMRRRMPWSATALCLAVLVTTAAGTTLLIQLIRDRPVQEATVAGLFLRLDHAVWLDDQMEHNERFPMPASMMPDMPPHGVFRLNAELMLHNPTDTSRRFHVSELFFRSSEKGMWPATGGELIEINLEPGRAINLYTYFDVADTEIEGNLRLLWFRDGQTVQMLDIPHPPDHFHEDEREEIEWPILAMNLGEGNPDVGERLFITTYHCIACHGLPGDPDSNNVGPHLGNAGSVAARRVPGKSAEQYLYESILDPNAYIAPECKNHVCESPSAMPPFGEFLKRQDMADLIAYMLTQRQ